MKKILITGVSSGLGEAIVNSLSKEFYIIGVARRMNMMKKKFNKISNVELHKLDIANIKRLNFFLKKIKNKHKDISYIINNAGFLNKRLVKKINNKDFDYSFRLNTLSPLLIMKEFLEVMKNKNFGRIINITSGAAYNCGSGFSLYSASKASLNVFSITAAKEYEKYNIKINLLSPGPIKTEMMPRAKLAPNIAINSIRFLLNKDKNLFTGKFVWMNRLLPTSPNLEGINWLKAKASNKYKKIFKN
jgi:short-subunit dehydrogenase